MAKTPVGKAAESTTECTATSEVEESLHAVKIAALGALVHLSAYFSMCDLMQTKLLGSMT